MTLIIRPKNEMVRFCLQHQKEWKLSELVRVQIDNITLQCPICTEETPAEFAREIGGAFGICVVHDGKGIQQNNAIAKCITCDNELCLDCIPDGKECIFCSTAPYGSGVAHHS